MLYKPISPFCIKAIDTTRQKAETRILAFAGVDALSHKGLGYLDQAFLNSKK